MVERCAVCETMRMKCAPNCVFKPHFQGPEGVKAFQTLHRIYGGRAKIANLLALVPQDQQAMTISSLVYCASMRNLDPVRGVTQVIQTLANQVNQTADQLSKVNDLINEFKKAGTPFVFAPKPATMVIFNLMDSKEAMYTNITPSTYVGWEELAKKINELWLEENPEFQVVEDIYIEVGIGDCWPGGRLIFGNYVSDERVYIIDPNKVVWNEVNRLIDFMVVVKTDISTDDVTMAIDTAIDDAAMGIDTAIDDAAMGIGSSYTAT